MVTGLFLDHRPIRLKMGQQTAGKTFLNLFAYTCSASVHAALGGAIETVSVDLSNTYLNWGKRNFALNGIAETHHHFIEGGKIVGMVCLKFTCIPEISLLRYCAKPHPSMQN